MLGSLATVLRMAGWDAAYALDRGIESDREIRRQAETEDRTLVTRDRQVADRTTDSILLTTTTVTGQVDELRKAGFDVTFDEPTRCSNCNGRLAELSEATETPEDAPSPVETAVWRCIECGQHFWKGSHWDDVVSRLGQA